MVSRHSFSYRSSRPSVRFYVSMSRLRSDTYIKPGSESSFESEDGNTRRFTQPTLDSYCCISNVSVKKAVITSGVVSSFQVILNFCLILLGCGVTLLDIALAIFPVVSGTAAVLFLTFALIHHSATSLKPYIAHHLVILIGLVAIFTLYVLVLFHQQTATDVIKWMAEHSSTFQSLMNAEGTTKLLFGIFLAAHICLNIFCLHISVGLYLILDTVVRYVSTEGTEII